MGKSWFLNRCQAEPVLGIQERAVHVLEGKYKKDVNCLVLKIIIKNVSTIRHEYGIYIVIPFRRQSKGQKEKLLLNLWIYMQIYIDYGFLKLLCFLNKKLNMGSIGIGGHRFFVVFVQTGKQKIVYIYPSDTTNIIDE